MKNGRAEKPAYFDSINKIILLQSAKKEVGTQDKKSFIVIIHKFGCNSKTCNLKI